MTAWLRRNWRKPHADHPDFWFAMTVARVVNEPETLAEIGYPAPWDPEKFVRAIKHRLAAGLRAYNPRL
jgi:hypothetical protein